MKHLLAIALLLATSTAISGDAGFDHVQIDRKGCALVQSGSRNLDVVWKGESIATMCHVRVDTAEFTKKYSYCGLSGVLGPSLKSGNSVMCEFGYSDKAKKQVFFMAGQDTLCEFVCVRR